MNEFFEINKIKKEVKESIEYVLNVYLKEDRIFDDNHNWYKKKKKNNFWEIINHLSEIK